MGVYLSTPNTEKISADGITESLSYGASSMQGWRMSQEDAHNCIPDFEKNGTSFFAVYDGHGGAEVAQYCAQNFPDYVKGIKEYKDGDLKEALVEAFLGFDGHILKEEVLKELKVMAGLDDDEEEESKKSAKSEADMLRAEADMPIEDLLAQYEGNVPLPQEIKNLRKKKNILSPLVRAKRPKFPTEKGDDDDDDMLDDEEKDIIKPGNANASSTVSSHSVSLEEKLANGHAENENNLNREKEQNEILQKQSLQQQNSENKATKISTAVCDSAVKLDDTAKGETTLSAQVEKIDSEVCSSSSSSVAATSSSSSSLSSSGYCSSNTVQISSVSSSDNITTDSDSLTPCNQETNITHSSEADSTSGEVGPAGSNAGSSQSDICVQSSSSGACEDTGPSSSGSGEIQGSSSGGKASDSDDEEGDEDKEVIFGDEESDDDDDDEDVEFDSEDDSEESEEEEDEDDDVDVPFANGSDPANDEPGFCSGCTAVVALIRNKEVVVANAGDSRCVLSRAGKAIDMSFDHKPEDDAERKRINAAGGKVTNDGRVNGGLNLSRAIGDHFYKRNESKSDREQMITALPDLETATLQEEDEFMILACDGIWNYMTSQEAVDFVKDRIKNPEKKKKLSLICEEIFDYCLAPNTMGDGTGCDNMTCIIVTFDQMWNNNKNKRASSQMEEDSSSTEEAQPEKRAKVDESASSET